MFKRLLAVLLLIWMMPSSWAQQWPSRPIRYIVPYAAGGPTDQLSRFVATQLGQALAHQVVVENITGAAGAIGMEKLVRAAPDGYTIGTSAHSLQTISPHQSEIPLPYDAVKDLTPIAGLASFPYVLLVPSSSKINSLSEFIATMRAAPGKVTYATGGPGQTLIAALLNQRTGTELLYVPYKGSAPAMNDLMGGHVDSLFEVMGSATSHVRAGKAKALAVSSLQRHPLFPEVPTLAESVPGLETIGWFALYGPAGLPPEIRRRLESELDKIQRSEHYKAFLARLGYEPLYDKSADLAKRQARDSVTWERVIREMANKK
jgi:tripartite-type tricarboxylate transporter receptor subunit TctC